VVTGWAASAAMVTSIVERRTPPDFRTGVPKTIVV